MLEDKFSPISEEETILSHRSVETFSQSLAHPVSSPFTFSGVCSHFHVHTSTNMQTQKIKNKYRLCFHIVSLIIVFSKTECDEAMEENINRIYCDHVNM